MRAKACAENVQLTDRDSAELLWRFLELLIKQNGVSLTYLPILYHSVNSAENFQNSNHSKTVKGY